MTIKELKQLIKDCTIYCLDEDLNEQDNTPDIQIAINAVDELVASLTPLTIQDFTVGNKVICPEHGKGEVTLIVDDTLWVQFKDFKQYAYHDSLGVWGRGKERSVSTLTIL
jgi:hypothetical protein